MTFAVVTLSKQRASLLSILFHPKRQIYQPLHQPSLGGFGAPNATPASESVSDSESGCVKAAVFRSVEACYGPQCVDWCIDIYSLHHLYQSIQIYIHHQNLITRISAKWWQHKPQIGRKATHLSVCEVPWQHAWHRGKLGRSMHGTDDVNIQEVVLSNQFQLPIWKPPSSHPPHCAVSIHLHVIASEILSPLSAVHGELATKLFSVERVLKRPETFQFYLPKQGFTWIHGNGWEPHENLDLVMLGSNSISCSLVDAHGGFLERISRSYRKPSLRSCNSCSSCYQVKAPGFVLLGLILTEIPLLAAYLPKMASTRVASAKKRRSLTSRAAKWRNLASGVSAVRMKKCIGWVALMVSPCVTPWKAPTSKYQCKQNFDINGIEYTSQNSVASIYLESLQNVQTVTITSQFIVVRFPPDLSTNWLGRYISWREGVFCLKNTPNNMVYFF